MLASSLTSVGRDEADRDQAGEHDRDVRGRVAAVELAQPAGDLAVDRQRVDVARDAEHRRRRRPEQHRRGDQGDDPAHRVAHPGRVVGGDDAEHRRLHEFAAERRFRALRAGDDRDRHQRDRGHPGVDERHRDGAEGDDPLEVARVHVEVRGEVGGGLDPGVGEHRDHRGVDDVGDAGVGEEVDLVDQPVGVQDGERADPDHGDLQGDVGERQHAQRALTAAPGDAGDVERAGGDDDDRGDGDLTPGLGEVGGDRFEVVRHRERRQRGDDQVVDQDRPAGDEGDQLVEGVAGEARGAAAFADHRPALDVAERGQHEHQPGGEEDQRGEAEAAVGDDAEREVDREADGGVDGDEEPGDADAAAQQGLQSATFALSRGSVTGRGGHRTHPSEPASPAHPRREPESQRRAPPTARKAMPISVPRDSGPPPWEKVLIEDRQAEG